MKFLLTLLISLFSFENSLPAHDSVKATFSIVEKGHVLMLEIDFDTHNFLKLNPSTENKITKEAFSKYLNQTTNWKIDDTILIPEVLSIQSSNHHSKAICFLSKKTEKPIQSIKVENRFFIDIKSHINVIELNLNEKYRDFQMDKDRKELTVTY